MFYFIFLITSICLFLLNLDLPKIEECHDVVNMVMTGKNPGGQIVKVFNIIIFILRLLSSLSVRLIVLALL